MLRRAACSPRCLRVEGLQVISPFDLLLDWQSCACVCVRERACARLHNASLPLCAGSFDFVLSTFLKKRKKGISSRTLLEPARRARGSRIGSPSNKRLLRNVKSRDGRHFAALQNCALFGSNSEPWKVAEPNQSTPLSFLFLGSVPFLFFCMKTFFLFFPSLSFFFFPCMRADMHGSHCRNS